MKKQAVLMGVAVLFAAWGCATKSGSSYAVRIQPSRDRLITGEIQKAIDDCAARGGGRVVFPAGVFATGGLHLKSNVTLQLDKGATLRGSGDYRDYGPWEWGNALIKGENLTNVAIRGGGTLDGAACFCPMGEEKFRGPHGIRLVNCRSIVISGIRIVRSANWAINCFHCRDARVERVTILGGHDGLHSRFGANFCVEACDFRTGDDAFAGNDNRDFVVRNCAINSSCNAFRFGCLNLLVDGCRIWGPGEYKHLIQQRNNTLAAFVHFSPKDAGPRLESGNWLVRNLTVDSVDHFYVYNYRSGNWQTGQPVTSVRFENVKATNVKKAFTVTGDDAHRFRLDVTDSFFGAAPGAGGPLAGYEGLRIPAPRFCNFEAFGAVSMRRVRFGVPDGAPVVQADNGGTVELRDIGMAGSKAPVPCAFGGDIRAILRE